MIIFLSELQKDHLSLIHQHSSQVLVDFCKLSIDYLNNGQNSKKISLAAEKMQVSVTVIQNCVHALVYLILEGCKHDLSEADFKSSLALAGFSSDHQDVLVKLYSTKKTEISSALLLLHQKDPSYQDFHWRFEVQISSRHSEEQVKPMIAMDFVLMTPKNIGQADGGINNSFGSTNNDNHAPVIINSSIQDAKAASHCEYAISHVLLQTDLPNLVHLTNTLEQALKESKSQHVRKVQRIL